MSKAQEMSFPCEAFIVTLIGVNSSMRRVDVISRAAQTIRIRGMHGNVVQYRLASLYRSHKHVCYTREEAEKALVQHLEATLEKYKGYTAQLNDRLASLRLGNQAMRDVAADPDRDGWDRSNEGDELAPCREAVQREDAETSAVMSQLI